MIRPAAIFAATAAIVLAFPAYAQAEADAEVPINQLIVYGDDPCPPSTGDEIVVCARKGEAERYRIPEALRQSESPANEAWTERVAAYEMVGATGTLSCSPVGPGGASGCTTQLIERAYAENAGGSDVRFGQLIAEARAERLSTIDEDAAAEQARVEQIEREYEARLRAESEAETDAAAPVEQEPLPEPGAQ